MLPFTEYILHASYLIKLQMNAHNSRKYNHLQIKKLRGTEASKRQAMFQGDNQQKGWESPHSKIRDPLSKSPHPKVNSSCFCDLVLYKDKFKRIYINGMFVPHPHPRNSNSESREFRTPVKETLGTPLRLPPHEDAVIRWLIRM